MRNDDLKVRRYASTPWEYNSIAFSAQKNASIEAMHNIVNNIEQ